MSEELVEESKAKMAELARKDAERVELEAAKNKVESYVYLIKNKLIDDEDNIAKVSTEEQRAELQKLAEDGEEWLYDDGDDADLETLNAKYAELSESAEKVWTRVKEMTLRPEAIKELQQKLVKVEEILEKWAETMPHITDEEKDEARSKVGDIRKWIEEQEEAQAAKQPHEDPAFLSEDVPGQSKGLDCLMLRLSKKKKPIPVKKDDDENKTDTETEGGEKKEDLDAEAESSDKEGADKEGDDEADAEEGGASTEGSDDSAEDEKKEGDEL